MNAAALFAGASTALVVAAVMTGVGLLGWPSDVRSERLDEQRLDDLQTISGWVELYRSTRDGLPETLTELTRAQRQRPIRATDPETREPYEYRVTGSSAYELCARFAKAFDAAAAEKRRFSEFWQHPAGRHCFALDAAPPAQR